MKKSVFLSAIVATVVMVMSSQAFAQGDPLLAVNNMISGSYISTNVNYAETGNGIYSTPTGLLDTEKGNVPGFGITLDMMGSVFTNRDYFHISYTQARGHTNYIGQLNGSSINRYGSVVSTSKATLTNFDLRYGVGFESGHSLMITPYIDLGKHAWYRGVNAGEKYYNWYSGIGLMAQGAIGHFAVLTIDGMFGSTLYPRIWVGGYDVALRQGQAPMYRIGAKANINLGYNVYANIGVDYTHFKYNISNIQQVVGGVMWEPDSTTKYITYNVGLGYSFN